MDEIHNERRRAGTLCAVQVVLDKLENDDRPDLQAALDDLTITASSIARAISKRGFDLKQESVTRHRRKECRCGTE